MYAILLIQYGPVSMWKKILGVENLKSRGTMDAFSLTSFLPDFWPRFQWLVTPF